MRYKGVVEIIDVSVPVRADMPARAILVRA
jgi:hypothetical protein